MPRVHRAALPSIVVVLAALVLPALAPGAGAAAASAAPTFAAPADSLIAYPPPRVRAWQMGLARPDRLQHASLSFTLAAGATLVTRRPRASFAGAFALGLAKELWDTRAGSFDFRDLAADAAGAALGVSAAGGRD